MIFDLDDDKKRPNKQLALTTDKVTDESLSLEPPPRSSETRHRYAPDYDPDTMDLFEGQYDCMDQTVNEELVREFSSEIEQRLRREMTTELAGILKDLKHHGKNEK